MYMTCVYTHTHIQRERERRLTAVKELAYAIVGSGWTSPVSIG